MNPINFLFLVLSLTADVEPRSNEAGKIYISKDQGVNWERVDNGFPSDAAVNAWVIKDGMVIAATDAHGIYISSDRLKSWFPASKGLPKNTRIISMISHRNILFAGSNTAGIFFSDDNGETWRPSSKGLRDLTIRAFYSMGPVLFAGTDDGIYSSADGKLWVLEKAGMQINTFSSVNNQLFAATNQGVLESTDGGNTWKLIFKNGAISSLAANSKEIYLLDFSGTVYRSTIHNFTWVKADLYLPFQFTFQLTPKSSRFFTTEWKGSFKYLNGINDGLYSNGLPLDSAFTELLNTPYGLLTATGPRGGC